VSPAATIKLLDDGVQPDRRRGRGATQPPRRSVRSAWGRTGLLLKKQVPNILSLSRIPLGVLFFLLFRAGSPAADYTALVILVSLATDVADGFLARRLGVLSEAGKWLDAFSDFVFFLFVYLSFHLGGIMPLALLVLFFAREVVMYSLVRPLSRARGLEVGARPAGKVKTALQSVGTLAVAVMSALAAHGIIAADAYRRAALGVLVLLIAASVLSLYWYVVPLFGAGGGARGPSGAGGRTPGAKR